MQDKEGSHWRIKLSFGAAVVLKGWWMETVGTGISDRGGRGVEIVGQAARGY